MNTLVTSFCNDCRIRGYSQRTIESYKGHVHYFLSRSSLEDISLEDLQFFLIHLRDERKFSNPTINAYFASLSTFFDYLDFKGMPPKCDILRFRKRYLRHYKKHHTPSKKQLVDLEIMRDFIHFIPHLSIQTLCIFLAKTGIRRKELVTLDRADLSFDRNTILLKTTGKRSNRLIYFDDECKAFLQAYLATRTDNNPALFLSSSGARITRTFIYEQITHHAFAFGIHKPDGFTHEKFTPHCFRVWFTTWLRRSGMSREFIKELRGDIRGETIDIYDQIQSDELKEAYLKHIPQFNLKPTKE